MVVSDLSYQITAVLSFFWPFFCGLVLNPVSLPEMCTLRDSWPLFCKSHTHLVSTILLL